MRITPEEYKALMLKRQPEPKPKYRNTKKTVGELTFDSAKEARYYSDLLAWQMSGQITNLRTQVPFQITVNGVDICEYFADFTYQKDGEFIVIDVKSKVTRKLPVYQLKKKLMLAALGISIQEV